MIFDQLKITTLNYIDDQNNHCVDGKLNLHYKSIKMYKKLKLLPQNIKNILL